MGLIIERGIPLNAVPRRGRPLRVHRDRKVPLLPLAAAGLLLGGLVLGSHTSKPTSLSDAVLTGSRQLAGTACIGVADDLSGSMTQYAPQRQAVKAALLPWLRANLRPDDQIAMADFTDQATVVLHVTAAADLPAVPPAEAVIGGNGTAVVPAINALSKEMKGRGCAATALIMITDGRVGDAPAELSRALAGARVTRAWVLNPEGGRADELKDPAVQAIGVIDVRHADASELGLHYARLVADLTGQSLGRR